MELKLYYLNTPQNSFKSLTLRIAAHSHPASICRVLPISRHCCARLWGVRWWTEQANPCLWSRHASGKRYTGNQHVRGQWQRQQTSERKTEQSGQGGRAENAGTSLPPGQEVWGDHITGRRRGSKPCRHLGRDRLVGPRGPLVTEEGAYSPRRPTPGLHFKSATHV